MTGSTRIQGDALILKLGGVDQYADVTSISLENDEADSGVVTYADAAGGGARQWFIRGSAVQSTQAGSFWRTTWDASGTTVAFEYAQSSTAASADLPHFTGTVVIGPKPPLGGDAGTSDQTFDFEWKVVGEPVPDYGSSAAGSINTITPAGKSAGQTVVITGSRFTGATDVKFASTSATSFSVVSDSTIVAVIPSGTGSKAVTVITPAGTSAAVNYTVV